jgi:hypothetical protein
LGQEKGKDRGEEREGQRGLVSFGLGVNQEKERGDHCTTNKKNREG